MAKTTIISPTYFNSQTCKFAALRHWPMYQFSDEYEPIFANHVEIWVVSLTKVRARTPAANSSLEWLIFPLYDSIVGE